MKDIFSCDDVCVMVVFQMDNVKYNFVKPFSPHVESVNDKKREVVVPTVSFPLTISLSASIINQSCDRLFLIARCALVSSLHTPKHLNQMLNGFISNRLVCANLQFYKINF